jgi:hypothetical protein
MSQADLRRVAKRVVWFKVPDETLSDVKLFLAHVMTYGTLSDISTVLQDFSEDDFEGDHKRSAAGSLCPPFLDLLERAVSSRASATPATAKHPCVAIAAQT